MKKYKRYEQLTLERTERTLVEFKGVNEAARRLNVEPSHLSQILRGKRTSRRLMARLAEVNVTVQG